MLANPNFNWSPGPGTSTFTLVPTPCGPLLYLQCDKSDNGCQGGSMESAFGWVHRHGIASESGYRYTASNSYCDTAKENKKVATVDGSTSVNGEDGLKSAVSMRSVSVGVDATCLQSYRGGILDQSGCSGQLDHGVLAVGYGTEGGKEYFKVRAPREIATPTPCCFARRAATDRLFDVHSADQELVGSRMGRGGLLPRHQR